MEAPAQVKRAVTLLSVSLALGILDSVLGAEPLEPEDAKWEAIIWLITGGVFLLVAALIFFIYRGQNWARITYLMLTVLTLIAYGAFPLDMQDISWWSLSLTGLTTVLDLIALYWLFSGSGSRWYSAKAAAWDERSGR